jgi:hypothetical protein
MVCFTTALIFSSRLSLVICRKEPGANRPKVYFLWVERLNAFGPMKQLKRVAASRRAPIPPWASMLPS